MLNLQVVAPYKALYKAVSMPAKKRWRVNASSWRRWT